MRINQRVFVSIYKRVNGHECVENNVSTDSIVIMKFTLRKCVVLKIEDFK